MHNLQGQKGAQLQARAALMGHAAHSAQVDIDMLSTADKKKWTRPPISVYFEVCAAA